MNKSFLFNLLFGLIFLITRAYSQAPLPNIIPPSPDVAALARYAEIPVSHSTGVPDISVPIYTVKAGRLSLPINISYHAGGIKARDLASVVGLGWALNAGGVIGRTVLGRRDESNDFIAPYKTTDDLSTARALISGEGGARDLIYFLQNMSKLNFETQSDRYAYNFNGKSGIFRYDWINGNIHLIPYAPLKISKQYVNNIQSPLNLYYVIIDEEGTSYYFEAMESTSQNGMQPTTAWHLTKMVSADQADQINFYYSTGEGFLQIGEQSNIVKCPGNDNGSATWDVPKSLNFARSFPSSQQYPQRLDSIVANNTLVKFNYLSDREDGRQMRLTDISISNRNNNALIRKASFVQSYFGNSTDHTLRLRLDNIQLGGSGTTAVETYSFGYNNAIGPGYYDTPGYLYPGGNEYPPYISEDYWGYPNSRAGGLPREFLTFLDGNELGAYGGDKNIDPSAMQYGIIQQIKYPTGGKSVFEFESNRSDDPNFYSYPGVYNAAGTKPEIGGLRVKSIKNYNSDNFLATQSTYTYDVAGEQQKLSAVLFTYQQPVEYHRSIVLSNGSYGGDWDLGIVVSDVASSSSVYPLSVLGSSPVVYAKVTEYRGTPSSNSGKTEYIYHTDAITTLESSSLLSSPKFISEFTVDNGTPRAMLQSKTEYRNVDGSYVRIHKLENQYSYHKTNEFLTGIRVDQWLQFKDLEGYFTPDDYDTPYLYNYLDSYSWEATKGHEDVALLDAVVDSTFSSPGQPVAKTTTYQYSNADHLQPTSKTVITSKNETFITQYKYPHDYAANAPYDYMVNTKHIWSPVVEEINFKNSMNSPLQSSKTDYSYWNGNTNQIYPLGISTKNGTNTNPETRVTYHGYDSQGNVLSVSKAGGPKVNYIYSYNGQYPIAKVENAEYSTVVAALGQSNIDYYQSLATPTDAQINTFVSPLRTALPDAQVTTYTYKPLVGMTSMTDRRGQTTSYEYDNFQRLSTIKDHNGDIVKQYCYNYAGQQTTCYPITVPVTVVNPGGGGTPTIGAWGEFENPTSTDGYNGEYHYMYDFADLYFRFYSNPESGWTPYTLSSDLDLNYSVNSVYSYNWGSDPSWFNWNLHIGAGSNSYYYGNTELFYYEEYAWDPDWGYLYDCYSYDYQVTPGTGYQDGITIWK